MNIRPGSQTPATPLPAPPQGGMSSMGSLGGMMGSLGFGHQAHRVTQGDNLETLAKAHLKDKATPKNIAKWVEQAKALNQLPADGSVQKGQALLLPSIFSIMGNAQPSFNFVALPDPEQLLKQQEEHHQRQIETLNQHPHQTRLKAYAQNPNQKPSPEDQRWLNTLGQLERNPNTPFTASTEQTQLKEAILIANQWREDHVRPTRLTRSDMASFSQPVQNLLKDLMGTDGQAGDLSQLDLSQVKPQMISTLMQHLNTEGYTSAEHKLVQLLQDLTRFSPVGSNTAYQFKKGVPHMVSDSQRITSELNTPEKVADHQKNNQAIKNILADSQYIEKGKINLPVLEWLTPTENDQIKDEFKSSTWSSNAAKTRLLDNYGFAPEDAHKLDKIKGVKSQLKTPQQVAEFISDYMTAHYEHSGSTSWSGMIHLAEKFGQSDPLFFGEHQVLDTLPDGRRLMDCEGFTKLSQTLLNHLAPQGTETMPVQMPGHIFTVAKMQGEVYVFNNDSSQKLDFKESHTSAFSDKFSDYDSAWDRLNLMRTPTLGKNDFSPLYDYIQSAHDTSGKAFKGSYLKVASFNNVFKDH